METKKFSCKLRQQNISPACLEEHQGNLGRNRKKTILTTILLLLIILIFGGFVSKAAAQITAPGVNPDGKIGASGLSQGNNKATPNATTGGGAFGNPIQPKTIEDVLTSIMSYLRGIAGTIAVIFIIIGGVMYMLSGGNKDAIERAKKTVIYAMIGLAIVLAAPLFYQEIKAILSGGNPGSALQQILMNVLRLLLSIVGFLAIISMVVGAIWMFTAVGDEEKYKLGKKTATYSILGLIIAVSALIIAQEVVKLFGSSGVGFGSLGSPTSSNFNNIGGQNNPNVPNLPTPSPSDSTNNTSGRSSGRQAPNVPDLPPSSLPSGWNRGGQD